MSRRLAKINKNIQRVFGEIIAREADLPRNILVTISRVETADNLQSAIVWLYVSPLDQAELVLKQLQPQMYDLQGAFNRVLNTRPLPRLKLKIDTGAAHSDQINRRLNQPDL